MEDGGLFSGGRSAGSSTVRLGGDAIGRSARAAKTPHWSERSESGMVVGVGVGIASSNPAPSKVCDAGSLLDRPFARQRGRRAAGDESIELVEAEVPVGLGRDKVVATGPGGSSHAEAVDQEQHQRPVAHRPSRL